MNSFSRIFLTMFSCVAFASTPEGFQLISGDAQPPVIGPDGTLTITSGKHAVVHWDKFSIGKETAVRFAQADQNSAILNRVVGSAESRIDGALLSNGKVFLVNKNGVVVGPNGRIDTAGFIASTLDMTNEDFFRGKELLFQGDSAQKVVNLGVITAKEGDIALIGQSVDNQGTLSAPQGHVLLGCGQFILLQPSGEERIYIRMPSPAQEEAPLQHSGVIDSLVAELKSGVTPFAKAIRSSGKIDALSAVEKGGKVFLVAEEGRLDVSGSIAAKQGENGGTIHLLGKEVYIADDAHIQASGDKAGGQILVGGDYQGSNPNIPNSDITFIAKTAKLEASALTQGDGGKVIIWAEKATGFFGHIEAQGGPQGGDGGFIEVSADHLIFEGLADPSAPNGKAGTILLDPTDITLQDGGTDTCPVTCWSGGVYTPPTTPCVSPNIITQTTLQAMLLAGNVTINTSSSCSDAGNITIAAGGVASSTSGTNTLTLNAVGQVICNGLLNTYSNNLVVNAGGNITCNTLAGFSSSQGNITVNSTGGSLIMNSRGTINNQPFSTGSISVTVAGDCAMTTTAGTTSIESSGSCTVNVGGNLNMNSSGGQRVRILSDTSAVLVIVGGTASLTDSVISTSSTFTSTFSNGTDVTLVVDNDNPSPPSIGSENPMLKTTATSVISSASGHFVRMFTATQGQNQIDPATMLGNGNAPTTFTPGTLFVDTATEIWSTYYPSSAGGNPYTFFYKDGPTPPPPPPSPTPAPTPTPATAAAAAAVTSNAVNNTAVTNLVTTQQNNLSLITTPPPPSGGQAIPLSSNTNENAINNTMSGAVCP